MMRRHNYRRHRAMAEINVVPYIDVMLVLLVIFMITAPLLTQGVDVSLPQASAKVLKTKEQEPIVISVDRQGLYYLNVASKPDKPIGAEQLQAKIKSLLSAVTNNQPAPLILVKGDRHANYGNVVKAMVLLQQAGVSNVGLLTDTKK